MKILISGSNGFLGRHVTKRLIDLNNEVIPLDRSKEIVKQVVFNQPDYIIHLAAYGNHYTQTNTNETYKANVELTKQLLEGVSMLSKGTLTGFINVSSSSVYGIKHTAMREDDTLETTTMYGTTKIAGEALVRGYSKHFDFPAVSIRPFSVFGEGEADHRFIPTVLRSIKTGEIMNLDPLPVHDWIYISDFVDGVMCILDHIQRYRGDAINIGTGNEYSNERVVRELEIITKGKANTVIKENQRLYDTHSWNADNSLLKSLGWRQKHSLVEGLKDVVKNIN